MSPPEGIDRRQALRRVGALLGGLISAPTVAGVLSGCERPSGTDWTPQTLTPAQNRMVATIADIIIPPTDTPGARAANVNRFIDTMVGEGYLPDDRNRFLQGLNDLDARSKEAYGAPFVDCSEEQQRTLIGKLDEETFGADAPEVDPEAPPFFQMMKELVIVGYYTSEIGATTELKTNLVPGRYDGDVPYDEVGRAWA